MAPGLTLRYVYGFTDVLRAWMVAKPLYFFAPPALALYLTFLWAANIVTKDRDLLLILIVVAFAFWGLLLVGTWTRSRQVLGQEWILDADKDGLTISVATAKTTAPWSGLARARRRSGFLELAWKGAGPQVIVPRRAFGDERQVSELLALARNGMVK